MAQSLSHPQHPSEKSIIIYGRDYNRGFHRLLILLLVLWEFSPLYVLVESFVVPHSTTRTTGFHDKGIRNCCWTRKSSSARDYDERNEGNSLNGDCVAQKNNSTNVKISSTNNNNRQPKKTRILSVDTSSLFSNHVSSNNNNNNNDINVIRQGKKKKNKYAQFSKTDNIDKDPLDVLIEESQQKLQAIQDELNPIQRRKRQQEQAISNLSQQLSEVTSTKLEFPNNRDIDPYDPSTFGYIPIGTIQGPHSVHGWAKVRGDTDFPERLTQPGTQLHIKPLRKRAPRPITLMEGKYLGGNQFLIQLQGIYDRDMVHSMKGCTLYYAKQQDKVQLQDDEVHVLDLVGLSVYQQRQVEDGDHDKNDTTTATTTTKQQLVGTVVGVVLAEELCAIPGLLHDQIEVGLIRSDHHVLGQQQPQPQQLVLIPMVPQIIPHIDLEGRCIIIDPPAGLLDLTYIREEKVKIKGLLSPAKE